MRKMKKYPLPTLGGRSKQLASSAAYIEESIFRADAYIDVASVVLGRSTRLLKIQPSIKSNSTSFFELATCWPSRSTATCSIIQCDPGKTKPTHGIMLLYKHDLNPKPGTQHPGGLSHSVQHRVIADPECRPRLSCLVRSRVLMGTVAVPSR